MSERKRRRQRETDLRRRGPRREERRVHLVVCEGETEKRYFDTMKKHPDVRTHVVHARKSKHPQRESVVESAATARNDEYTRIWAVFDTDGENVEALVAKAYREGIHAAASTPTFETWLILHLKDHRSAFATAAKAEKELKALLPRWTKGGTDFDDFAHGLKDACERAALLPPTGDPSTGVHRLVRAIVRD